jgi:SAM-dependent methyltransferase
MREVMNRELHDILLGLPPDEQDAVEVSGDLRSDLPWRSYTAVGYPEFDLCDRAYEPERTYDVVICEQVLEHVTDPLAAVSTLAKLCRPGGRLFVSTPFLVRIHELPGDYWRFTPGGLRLLLESADLKVDWVHSWGSRRCAKANLGRWTAYRWWRSLRNEPDVPLMVWAAARRGL